MKVLVLLLLCRACSAWTTRHRALYSTAPRQSTGGSGAPLRHRHSIHRPASSSSADRSSSSASPSSSFPEVSPPDGFAAPEPRPLTVTGDVATLLSATFALALRGGTGAFVEGWRPVLSLSPPAEEGGYALQLGPLWLSDTSAVLRGECARPTGRLILYEFDSSPFCRKVRDAASLLDLELDIRPCPGALSYDGGFSDEHFARTGRRTVPFLIDEGAGVELFESEDIVDHLYDRYGPGRAAAPAMVRGSLALFSSGSAAIVRLMPAAKLQVDARADNARMQPLTLYGYEASPFVHPVREKLSALGLPHTMVNCARGSANRAKLIARTGRQFQVPYLVDPNTGVALFESIEIRVYLDRTYTTSGYSPLVVGGGAAW